MDNKENLGPAERIIQSLLTYQDHLYHGRPGVVVPDARTTIGVRWDYVAAKTREDGVRVVYRLAKGTPRAEIGTMNGDNTVRNGTTVVGSYRPNGLFPEVAAWFYRQIAAVWQLDNEFAARWASFAFQQEHKDLKVVLAAFMLCQSRKGDPIMEDGKCLFLDEDYRDVGEAMMLLQQKDRDLNPKLLLRIRDVLRLPEIATINHELGFGKSARRPFLGRWPLAVEKWLRYREENPKMLKGLVRAGFRRTVRDLAQRVGYKPTSDRFFEILRWKQRQTEDGRRELAIGKEIKAAESWAGLDEKAICEKIEKDRPGWKLITGLLPPEIGVTRAVAAAAIEAGCLSDKDLIIMTPTLEDLGLLKVQEIRERLDAAIARADDMRAANIARNVRSKEVKEKLEAGADKAAKRAVEEVVRDIRVYVLVDASGSMENALEAAKAMVAKLIQGLPSDRVHVAVFNTAGREIVIKHASTKGVEASFRGIRAGGGTEYGSGVMALSHHKPGENEDSLFIFVGDEEQHGTFERYVAQSALRPLAFGFLKVRESGYNAVHATAAQLGIPCFRIDGRTFDDPYAIPRTLRALIAATPVGQVGNVRARPRVTLVDQILKTELLRKPAWA